MNKEGFIKILQYGRKTRSGKKRFTEKWIDKNEIQKKERATCCYAYFTNPVTNIHPEMVEHVCGDEHIMKLIARLGWDDEYLLREVRYYSGKILNQEERRDENLPF